MNRNLVSVWVALALALTLGLLILVGGPKDETGLTEVNFFDVGQGDSIFIQTSNGKQMLIDGGKSSQVLMELSRAMPLGDKTIDVVIATHPDADHIGGLIPVLSRYNVGLFLTSEVATDTEVFRDLYKIIEEKNILAYYVRRGMRLSFDDMTTFEILFPDRDTNGWETNTASVVSRLDIGETSVLLTGDSPISIEKHLAKTEDIDVDILQIGHHGSKTSTGLDFLKATTPKLALISAGANNRYGHPAPEVMALLKSLRIQTLTTIENGTVTLQTDGEKWTMKK